MNGPDGVGNTFVSPVSSSGKLMASPWRLPEGPAPRRWLGRRPSCSRPSDAVSVATTCARTCVACSSCASCATLRGRGSSTGIGAPSVAGGPGTIGTMRSDSRIASSTLLVIITVVTGRSECDPSCASSCCSVSRVSASSAPNGSSRKSTCGSVATARAMATRCRMPPDSCRGRRFTALPRPTLPSASRRPRLSAARGSGPETRLRRRAGRSRAP